MELHHVAAPDDAPHVLLLHGLEGSPRSHYVGGMFALARDRGWGATLLLFRGCGSVPNLARRFYHSGETTDLAWAFSTLAARWPRARWFLAGVSLGGNVLLKWLGEQSESIDPRILGAVAVSVPFDLEAGARHIAQGFARVYDRSFLRSLRDKAIAKLDRYPDLFDLSRLRQARHVHEFDDAVTAPVHGFLDAHDYYHQSSSIRFVDRIRVSTLLLSSSDDPFLPASVLERVRSIATSNAAIQLEFLHRGGHVGFVAGRFPWRASYYAESRTYRFFDETLKQAS